jgi:hypothetical protein
VVGVGAVWAERWRLNAKKARQQKMVLIFLIAEKGLGELNVLVVRALAVEKQVRKGRTRDCRTVVSDTGNLNEKREKT